MWLVCAGRHRPCSGRGSAVVIPETLVQGGDDGAGHAGVRHDVHQAGSTFFNKILALAMERWLRPRRSDPGRRGVIKGRLAGGSCSCAGSLVKFFQVVESLSWKWLVTLRPAMAFQLPMSLVWAKVVCWCKAPFGDGAPGLSPTARRTGGVSLNSRWCGVDEFAHQRRPPTQPGFFISIVS